MLSSDKWTRRKVSRHTTKWNKSVPRRRPLVAGCNFGCYANCHTYVYCFSNSFVGHNLQLFTNVASLHTKAAIFKMILTFFKHFSKPLKWVSMETSETICIWRTRYWPSRKLKFRIAHYSFLRISNHISKDVFPGCQQTARYRMYRRFNSVGTHGWKCT